MFFKTQPGAYHRKMRAAAEKAEEEAARPTAHSAFVIPDLLHRDPCLAIDGEALLDLLGLGFLGKDLGGALHKALADSEVGNNGWPTEFFANDLFISSFVASWSRLDVGGRIYPANQAFLSKVLTDVPTDLDTIRLRQGILTEIDEDPEMRDRFESLYQALFTLLSLFETPGYQGSLDTAAIHLEILLHSKAIIDRMSEDFRSAKSALRRLHEAGVATQATPEYGTLAALLDYEQNMADLTLHVRIGGDGKIRAVKVGGVQENGSNPFHVKSWRRLTGRLRLLASGYDFTNKELMKRTVNEVFDQLAPSLIPLIQLLGHLEFYLCSLSFRSAAEARGLRVGLATFGESETVELDGLFNPLLMAQAEPPVPCSFSTKEPAAITLVTGPNSGGKTRLLQALGWVQLLGQSGVYCPAARASLPLANGLYVSLVENDSADQIEGRLGRELVRIRSLFEEIRSGSVVIMDELCSGTNPSEGVEVFALVLKLLRQVNPTAYVTTHFLDFARSLRDDPPIAALEFLRVELDDNQLSTYQFVDGVAPTSLATLTAARLGVTFERLSAILRERNEAEPPTSTDQPAEETRPQEKTSSTKPRSKPSV